MKIKIIERILLAFYAFLGLIGAGVAVFLCIYRESFTLNVMDVTLAFESNWWPTVVILIAIALILLLWSMKIFTLAFRRERKTETVPSVSVQNTEDGSVRISVEAMDTLVKQAIGHQEGILDVKAKIINHDDSISVRIDMTLTSDVHIPNVTMLLQRTVKNFVEEFSGIAVREVTVLVSSIVEVVPAPLAIETQGESAAVQQSGEAESAPLGAEKPAAEAPTSEESISEMIEETSTVETINDPEAVILDEGSPYLTVDDTQEEAEIRDEAEAEKEGP